MGNSLSSIGPESLQVLIARLSRNCRPGSIQAPDRCFIHWVVEAASLSTGKMRIEIGGRYAGKVQARFRPISKSRLP